MAAETWCGLVKSICSAPAHIRAANDDSVPEEKLRAAFAECWRVALDTVADKYGFTEAMRAAGWPVFRQTEVTEPMSQSRSD